MKQILSLSPSKRVYSVYELNRKIKTVLDNSYELTDIRVKGEIMDEPSPWPRANPAYYYFTLKEAGDFFNKGNNVTYLLNGSVSVDFLKGLTLKKGMSVIVRGDVSFSPKYGNAQLLASEIEPDGFGREAEELALLREKLRKEGLFDVAHKKLPPPYFSKLGIISNKKAQGYEDFINNTRLKNPFIELYLMESIMQGQGAVDSIISGLKILDSKNLDVILITRGGGSEEEMKFFNDEALVRAVYACKTPVVSAVGHHRFEPLLNDVADFSCSTPSMVVNDVIWSLDETLAQIAGFKKILDDGMFTCFAKLRDRVKMRWLELEKESPVRKVEKFHLSVDFLKNKIETEFVNQLSDYISRLREERLKLLNNNPKKLISEFRLRLEREEEKLGAEITKNYEKTRQDFRLLVQTLDGLSPLKRLEEGYSYAETSDGRNLKSIEGIKIEDKIKLSLSDGKVLAKVEEVYDGRGKSRG